MFFLCIFFKQFHHPFMEKGGRVKSTGERLKTGEGKVGETEKGRERERERAKDFTVIPEFS